ncbi:glycosyltransferase family 2 protein [Planctomyces sp. SH-PL14]|uniref:glycosyltransferase family 2 protein n=1 Tax=Planctomyces sp. SH-PL14 TaxID=1632864 RepID=UPI00078C05F6|nr:glycosyltransferase [Planctomyces sp. SH-PL14]AMV16766.1 UDP-Glc:alpha-D-GlcNAc-diphosphoundecaprenol beta-1,3-glucosyltransferase WfgD [Planctomyces sp. SH-PL14]
MSSTPLVSIVIPCFNAESFVGEAIWSALHQTYPNVEVIVVDDGSADGSLAVVRSFGDAIRWQTGPNRGGCAARNQGLRLAAGEFVQFLDADDVLAPDKLVKQVAVARENPEAIVYCDHDLQGGPGGGITTRGMPCGDTDGVVFVLRHRALTTIAPLHRKEWLIDVGGFREGLKASQEFDLHLRLAATGRRFVHLPEALFTVRRRSGSVSADAARTLAALIAFLPGLIEQMQAQGALTADRRSEFAAYAARAGRQCCRGKQFEAGLQLLNLAFRLDRRAATQAAYTAGSRLLLAALGPGPVEHLAALRQALSVNGLKRIAPGPPQQGSAACAE